MKILILAVTGFIGSAVNDALAARSTRSSRWAAAPRAPEREAGLNRDVNWLTDDLSAFEQAPG